MEIKFTPQALEDIAFWKKSGDKISQKKISDLIADITKHPYEGIGKPHGLKHELSGKWAREINKKDRLVYQMLSEDVLEIKSAKGHYSDK
jgi:toxin YoeB